MIPCTSEKLLFWIFSTLTFLFRSIQNIISELQIFNNKNQNDVWKIPGPIHIPFLGTKWIYMWKYKTDKLHDVYKDIVQQYGDIVKETNPSGYVILHVAGKSDIEKVLRHPSRYPIRAPSEIIRDYRLGRPDKFSSAGIAMETGEIWHDLRSKLTPELTSRKTMLGFLPELNLITDDFIQLLKNNRNSNFDVNDFDHYSKRYSLESCCTLVLGQRMSFMENEISHKAQLLCSAMAQRFEAECDSSFKYDLNEYKKLPAYKKYLECEEILNKIISEIVETAQNSKNEIYSDVQCILMSIVSKPDVDEKEKKSVLIDFVAAGISTLSSSLMFLLYLLSKNPEAQEKLWEEINEAAPNCNNFTALDLSKMPYTKACMLESFRLIPVAFAVNRILDEDMNLSGYNVPAGTLVLCHTKIACQNEKYFTNPDKFMPERWLDNNKESQNAATCMFAPFGHGKRMCPGKRFVEQAMVVAIAKIVREFKIEHDGEMDVQFKFILCPKSPVKFRLKDRC